MADIPTGPIMSEFYHLINSENPFKNLLESVAESYEQGNILQRAQIYFLINNLQSQLDSFVKEKIGIVNEPIVTAAGGAGIAALPSPAINSLNEPIVTAEGGDSPANNITMGSGTGGGNQVGGVRYNIGRSRNSLLNMGWLTRPVNRLTLKNLQREENRLSESEHDEMPGRKWLRRGGARKTRRQRRH